MIENRNGKTEETKAPAARRVPWQTPKLRSIPAREAETGPNPVGDGGFTTS